MVQKTTVCWLTPVDAARSRAPVTGTQKIEVSGADRVSKTQNAAAMRGTRSQAQEKSRAQISPGSLQKKRGPTDA